jgi:hypothetical protein
VLCVGEQLTIKDIIREAKKEISESLIVNINGKDTLIPLQRLKKSPLHLQLGNKVIGEVRYQGEKGRKSLRKIEGEIDFTTYFRKDGMQIVGFESAGVKFLKVKGGAHDVVVSFEGDDVFQRHKLMFSIAKFLGYRARHHKQGGWDFYMPKNR